jgi:APA family basic amino acid/polyamine antiporter
VIFIAAYIFVAISIAIDKPNTALTATGVLAAFMVLYFVARRISSSNNKAG